MQAAQSIRQAPWTEFGVPHLDLKNTTAETLGRISHRPAVQVSVGVGANLGHAQITVEWAMAELKTLSVGAFAASSCWGSAPVDACGPDFVNAVVQFLTPLTAPELLGQLQAIEMAAGRQRPYRNAPRTLDLDLLLYGESHIQSAALTVPHPRMWMRAFVVRPLMELATVPVDAALAQSLDSQWVWQLPPINWQVSDGHSSAV